MKQADAIDKLCTIYRDAPQIGLVLGAGVSRDSGVPLFADLALRLFQLAHTQQRLRDVPESIIALVTQQGLQAAGDPDKIVQYLYEHLDSHESMRVLVKEALYRHVDTHRSHKMVGRRTYCDNATLDGVISFCAARPGSTLAPESTARWETNPKVGAILTTNYDNLVEGAFGTKYGRSLLKPVAREEARETMPGKRVIPVYHMHGYVSYVDDPRAPDGVKASELVIAEEDYYRTYYNLLGFSNIVATSVLRQFPALFIGSSMADRNLRRMLYHLRRERIHPSTVHEHFAILPPRPPTEQELDASILRSLNVTVIWLEDQEAIGAEIESILRRVYVSLDDVSEDDWQAVKRGKWSRRRTQPPGDTPS
jgi:hypothetical protein